MIEDKAKESEIGILKSKLELFLQIHSLPDYFEKDFDMGVDKNIYKSVGFM